MMSHVRDAELALYATGDLNLVRLVEVRLHIGRCEPCRRRVAAYREDRAQGRELAAELPAGLDWESMAREMSANIRVGLAAGECVAPRIRKKVVVGWRPAIAAAGIAALISVAWWLNFPSGDAESLSRVMHTLVRGRQVVSLEDRRPVVSAYASGIELTDNGGRMALSQGAARPVALSVNVQGSASARYVDDDTGQVTITSVYVQ